MTPFTYHSWNLHQRTSASHKANNNNPSWQNQRILTKKTMKYKKYWNRSTKTASCDTGLDERAASLMRIHGNLQNILIMPPASSKPFINQTLMPHGKSGPSPDLQKITIPAANPFKILHHCLELLGQAHSYPHSFLNLQPLHLATC